MVPRLMLTTPFSEYGYQLPLTSGAHEFSYASGDPASSSARHETHCDHRFFPLRRLRLASGRAPARRQLRKTLEQQAGSIRVPGFPEYFFFFFFFRMHLSRMRACACVFRVRVFRFTPECDFYAVNAFSFQHVKLQGAAVLESNGTLFPAVTSQCAVLHPFRSMHRCRASIIVRPIVAIGSIYPTADSG